MYPFLLYIPPPIWVWMKNPSHTLGPVCATYVLEGRRNSGRVRTTCESTIHSLDCVWCVVSNSRR